MMDNDESSTSLAVLLLSKRRGIGLKRAVERVEIPQTGSLFEMRSVVEAAAAVPASVVPVEVAERRIWSVAALVNEIRGRMEARYADIWVEGEISNCRPAASGHSYFTLKDGEAQLSVVMFRRQAGLLKWKPVDGMAVLVRGRVSVYESRGQLQLIAETMEPKGAGALLVAFEQRKERLRAEGLFAAERKRALPGFPRCIGVITSLQGAVIRDMVTVCRRRHANVNLLVYPAAMQGADCAAQVVAGLRWFSAHRHRADVVVIARGGGSAEDLGGFNDEALARAIAASEVPVVSAIGHETDFTIADFVADLRAPTPSAAAELVTAMQHKVEERVEELGERARRAGQYRMIVARQRFARLSSEAVLRRLRDGVGRREQRLDEQRFRMDAAWRRVQRGCGERLAGLEGRLRRQDVTLRLAESQRRLESLRARLERVPEREMRVRRIRVERAEARLAAMNPLAVLERGYALVYAADGSLLRDGSKVSSGQEIEARLAKGRLRAVVTEAKT